MSSRLRWLLAMLVATGVFSGAGWAGAAIVPLQDLLDGETITVGDVEFYGFSYTNNIQYSGYPRRLTPDVWPLRVQSVDGGLRFIGPLRTDYKLRGPGLMDFDISYRMRTPGFAVEGANLESTISAEDIAFGLVISYGYGPLPPPSHVRITQTITDGSNDELATLSNYVQHSRPADAFDTVNYESAQNVLVTTNIRIDEDGGYAELREFIQTFNFTEGTNTTLPTPTTLMILLPLVGGLVLHRQRNV